MTISCDKKECRSGILKLRRAMCKDKDLVTSKSCSLVAHLLNWPVYQSAKTVMMFLSMPDEPQMVEAVKVALEQGKRVCIPSMRETPGIMDAALIRNLDDLIVGQYDLLVPNPATLTILDPSELDLIVVPGVAFDRNGNRMGMGAGFYDRFLLKATKAELIGAVWSNHILEQIPVDIHDRQVNYLLTEEGIQTCRA